MALFKNREVILKNVRAVNELLWGILIIRTFTLILLLIHLRDPYSTELVANATTCLTLNKMLYKSFQRGKHCNG